MGIWDVFNAHFTDEDVHFTDEEVLSMPYYRYETVTRGLSKDFLFKVSEARVKI